MEFIIPLDDWVNTAFDKVNYYISPILRAASVYLEAFISKFEDILMWPLPIITMAVIGAIIWIVSTRNIGITAFIGLLIAFSIGVWDETMATVALALSGTAITLLFGIPLGILASQNNMAERIIRPILDFMQTLPSFVYLIPAVMFFGMGKVAALFATMIFAMPPAVRMTNLGIREVSGEMVEAATAFGSTKRQTLFDVQLPLAMPTIMAGVNQCIMMALSMTVIASMIGAGGLGNVVLRSMQSLDIGMGVVGGLSIVILAIILDRLTESLSDRRTKQLKS